MPINTEVAAQADEAMSSLTTAIAAMRASGAVPEAELKKWLRAHLRDLAVTDERELVTLRMSGHPDPYALAG